MLYKLDNKRGYRFLPHQNKSTHKLHMSTQQAESNVQSSIDLFVDTMSNQIKGIGNGRQDVQRLLLETWNSLQEHNDQVYYMERPTFFVSIW